MNVLLAAYKLGYQSDHLVVSAENLAREMRLIHLRGDAAATQIRARLDELKDLLSVVAFDIPGGVVQALNEALRDLYGNADCLSTIVNQYNGDDRWLACEFIKIPFVKNCRKLVDLMQQAFKKVPRLYWWKSLGSTLSSTARTAHSMLPDRATEPLPDIQPILEIVPHLPISLVKRITCLHNLPRIDPTRRSRRSLEILAKAVNWQGVSPKKDPDAALMLLVVEELYIKIEWALQDMGNGHELSLHHTDPGSSRAMLDGDPFAITDEQLLILRSLLKANGQFITRQAIQKEHGNLLLGLKINQQIRKLPSPIHDLIASKRSRSGGYCLNLD